MFGYSHFSKHSDVLFRNSQASSLGAAFLNRLGDHFDPLAVASDLARVASASPDVHIEKQLRSLAPTESSAVWAHHGRAL